MRPRRATALIVLSLLAVSLAIPAPVLGQDTETYERPPFEDPLEGTTRSDGTIVLGDADFCSHLLGSIWGLDELTPAGLIDRTKKQRKARQAAFAPATDEAVLQRCEEVLNAFRLELPEDDSLPDWARRGPVVPEAFAGLLPPDLLAEPLAEPDPVGDGSRTIGFGDQVSAPFGLTGGAYLVQVDPGACESWSGTMRGVRDPSLVLGPVSERGYLYDVVPAIYYWDVQAPACDWSVDLVAVELGPEPTPTPTPKVEVPLFHGDPNLTHLNLDNPEFVPVADARAALLELGLTPGDCTEGAVRLVPAGRVLEQDPPAGSLVEPGTAVNVVASGDCDVFRGERVIVE